jgi:DNA (cytosine-5)-methyltransferase 1
MVLTELSLCSGIGGFSLGLEQTGGFEVVAFAETDPFCQKVLAHHWPGRYQFGDVANVTTESMANIGLSNIGIVTAGFPCQPFSKAGNGLGEEDPRHLWPQIRRVISEVRPKYVLLENVPGLLSNGGGKVFGRILSDLALLRYDAEWQVLSAASVGAWHQRDRVWIVAYPSRNRRQGSAAAQSTHRNGQRHTAALKRGQRVESWTAPIAVREDVSDCDGNGLQRELLLQWGRTETSGRSPRIFRFHPQRSEWWTDESGVGKLVHGIPRRSPEIAEWKAMAKANGNAVVPPLVRQIGEWILEDHRGDGYE